MVLMQLCYFSCLHSVIVDDNQILSVFDKHSYFTDLCWFLNSWNQTWRWLWWQYWGKIVLFLDQELIPYRCSSSSCWGNYLQKSLMLRHFKSNRDEIWQDCSSGKYASIDIVGLWIWCHTFKLAAMKSFSYKSAAVWWVHTLQQPLPVPDPP